MTIGSTTVGSMASSFVQFHRRILAPLTLHATWWHGRMAKSSRNLRTMASYMSTTWTVIFKGQSLTLLVQELTISRSFQLLRDMQFSFGPKIRLILLERVIMESTLFSIFEFIKARIESSFQFSTTKFRMSNGHRTGINSLLSRVNSQQWLRCTIWMVSRHLNSVSNSETR